MQSKLNEMELTESEYGKTIQLRHISFSGLEWMLCWLIWQFSVCSSHSVNLNMYWQRRTQSKWHLPVTCKQISFHSVSLVLWLWETLNTRPTMFTDCSGLLIKRSQVCHTALTWTVIEVKTWGTEMYLVKKQIEPRDSAYLEKIPAWCTLQWLKSDKFLLEIQRIPAKLALKELKRKLGKTNGFGGPGYSLHLILQLPQGSLKESWMAFFQNHNFKSGFTFENTDSTTAALFCSFVCFLLAERECRVLS